jgi:transposase-like protein
VQALNWLLVFYSRKTVMNAPTYNTHSVTCPICHRSSVVGPVGMVSGLFSCPHCHSHMVISWSGHFVRDPFSLKQLTVGKMLRRESRPLARIQRDLGIGKHFPLLALLGSAIFLGFAIVTTERALPHQQSFQQEFLEWVNGSGNSQDVSR